jgi:hypothetical protein
MIDEVGETATRRRIKAVAHGWTHGKLRLSVNAYKARTGESAYSEDMKGRHE